MGGVQVVQPVQVTEWNVSSAFLPFVLETLLLGANIILFPLAAHAFRRSKLGNWAKIMLSLAAFIMLAASVLHWSLTMLLFLKIIRAAIAFGQNHSGISDFVERKWISVANIFMANAILVSRLSLSFNRFSIFFLGIVVVVASTVVICVLGLDEIAVFSSCIGIAGICVVGMGYNLWSSKSASRNTGDEEPSRTVASAIVIFSLESGFLYGLFWTVIMSFFLLDIKDVYCDLQDLVASITGIYSTVILVLVSKRSQSRTASPPPDIDIIPRSQFLVQATTELPPSLTRSRSGRVSVPIQYQLSVGSQGSPVSWLDLRGLGSRREDIEASSSTHDVK